jgi:hypothetical protein
VSNSIFKTKFCGSGNVVISMLRSSMNSWRYHLAPTAGTMLMLLDFRMFKFVSQFDQPLLVAS